jgi:hypothetical protein
VEPRTASSDSFESAAKHHTYYANFAIPFVKLDATFATTATAAAAAAGGAPLQECRLQP